MDMVEVAYATGYVVGLLLVVLLVFGPLVLLLRAYWKRSGTERPDGD